MNEKKITIMEAAIKLFAKKGFDATSIQEIATKSGISKGAFYLHFRSKEELVLSIFQHYSQKIERKMFSEQHAKLPPKERIMRQLEKYFEEIVAQKEVIILQFREQVLFMNEDIEQFFKKRHREREQWVHASLLSIYGEPIRPYLLDVSRLFDGMNNAYMKLMIVNGVKLDVAKLADFIVRRLDDIATGIIGDDKAPILTEDLVKPLLRATDPIKRNIARLLRDMETELDKLTLDEKRKAELRATLNFLLEETKKGNPKKFIFKGMLANFDDIEQLQSLRDEIASMMEID